MELCMPLPLTAAQLDELVPISKDFAFTHGLVYRSRVAPQNPDAIGHAPYTLLPSSLPRRCFDEAVTVQIDFNLLMHRVAHDHAFLGECLHSVIKVDEFTRRLWQIYEATLEEGVAQPLCLAITRSDYMFDYRPPSPMPPMPFDLRADLLARVALKQIEFNTISASFAGLSQRVSAYHSYVLSRLGFRDENLRSVHPANESVTGLARGLVTAWRLYNRPQAALLFLVYAVERNIYDQRLLEYEALRLEPAITVLRCTLDDVDAAGRLDDKRTLTLGGREVALVYMRSCYTPSDFSTESQWRAFTLLHRSTAILCPTLGYQLAGTKKVQQVLAGPGVVERFLGEGEAAGRVRATFAAQYSLDMNAEGDANLAMAVADPDRFVLKPQREGGGNNTFGAEVGEVLQGLRGSEERASYILMERIHPLLVHNYPIMAPPAPTQPPAASEGDVQLTDMVSELGVYGVLVGTKDSVTVNEACGHLLRTKKLGTDEGGVATGYSVLDSPFLVS